MIEAGVDTSDPTAIAAFYESLPEGIQAYLATGEGRDFTKDTFPADREEMLAEIKKRLKQTQGA